MAKQKGGDWMTALELGTAFYAARRSSSFYGFLWKFFKYALFVTIALAVVGAVLSWLGLISVEHFVPVAPSKEGDKKAVTPAGNVILY